MEEERNRMIPHLLGQLWAFVPRDISRPSGLRVSQLLINSKYYSTMDKSRPQAQNR